MKKFENRNFYTPRSVDKATAMHLKGVPSPYSVVKDALSTLIKNPLKEEIDLPNGNKTRGERVYSLVKYV